MLGHYDFRTDWLTSDQITIMKTGQHDHSRLSLEPGDRQLSLRLGGA